MIRPQERVARLVREQTPKIDRQSQLRLDINENITGWQETIVRELLAKLKRECLVLDWARRERTRANVQLAIIDGLYPLQAKPQPDGFKMVRESVYQYVTDSYSGAARVPHGVPV